MIRNELFIPANLLKRHRDLMYRKKHHHILNEESLEVTVVDEIIRLKPKERQFPVKWHDFHRALKLMRTPTDLDAIPGLLEGFNQAQRPLGQKYVEQVARIINVSGRPDLIMEIARNTERFGFKLTRAVAREFMRGLQIEHGILDRVTALKSLNRAEQLLEICEAYRKDPVMYGTALAMVASTQVRFNDSKDKGGITLKYVRNLSRVWDKVEWEQDLVNMEPGLVDDDTRLKVIKSSMHKARQAVLDYTPVLEGMRQAKEVMDSGGALPPSLGEEDATRRERRLLWLENERQRLEKAISGWNTFLEKNRSALQHAEKRMYGQHIYKEALEKLMERMAEKSGNQLATSSVK